MTVKSKTHKGLQSRGNTEIDGDFTISKSGTKVSISSGTFVDVEGNEYNVPATEKDIGESSEDREIGIWLYDSKGTSKVHIGEDKPENILQMFVAPDWFKVPANTLDLSKVEMHAFGWIDEHPRNMQASEVVHDDIQKLKKDGTELEMENSEKKIQEPQNKQKNEKVREAKS